MDRKKIGLNFLTLSITVSSLILFHLPLLRGYFYGDDFLVYQASNQKWGYASRLSDSFFQGGGGKYRPAFTPAITILLNQFDNHYIPFQIFSFTVLGLSGILATLILTKIFESSIWISLTPIVVVLSRFNWYVQTSVHGTMEALALLWFLCSLNLFLKWLKTQRTKDLIFSQFFIFLAVFTHERYAIAVLVFAVLSVVFKKFSKASLKIATIYIWILAINFFLKQQVIGLSAIAGGGESSVKMSVWVLHHFAVGIAGVFGLSSGVNDYFEPNGYGLRDPFGKTVLNDFSRYSRVLLILILFTYLLVSLRQLNKRIMSRFEPPQFKQILTVAVLGISLLIPGATVISRYESRWLLASDVCLWIVVISLAQNLKKSRFLIVAFAFFLIIQFSARNRVDEFSYDRKLAQNILGIASENQTLQAWNLNIQSQEISEWMFGYGAAFQQLHNPPYLVEFNQRTCPNPCLIISTDHGAVRADWAKSSKKVNEVHK